MKMNYAISKRLKIWSINQKRLNGNINKNWNNSKQVQKNNYIV